MQGGTPASRTVAGPAGLAQPRRGNGVLPSAQRRSSTPAGRHSGAHAKRASPESITPAGGYGFPARARRRVPE
ncbi:hypothetical protein BJA5080_01582 [Bradyrhizobium diazoefficiens SEMIA 5080]|uniref:Uncharacterized protein n=1 Tax=Bradyrhizobium diazoefficiens SEMIA 5080 TaxID=754504 RepID=A0A837C6V3_9BRAD|nr:hypothetical protein BJA5080_01582 [Bradyrhizobium diazoefficiens SEMIA 5080]